MPPFGIESTLVHLLIRWCYYYDKIMVLVDARRPASRRRGRRSSNVRTQSDGRNSQSVAGPHGSLSLEISYAT